MKRFIKSTSVHQSPLLSGIVFYLLLEHLQSPGWIYWIVSCIFAISMLCSFLVATRAESIEDIVTDIVKKNGC